MTVIFFSFAFAIGRQGRVERRRRDPFVLGKQVVGELVEVRNAADHRGPGDEVVAIGEQLLEQPGVLGVAANERYSGRRRGWPA